MGTDEDDHKSSLKDPAFERDVLLNFLLGMKQSLQGKVISSNERTLLGFLQEAIKSETDHVIIKEEDDDLPDFNDILPKNGKWKVTIDRIGTPSPPPSINDFNEDVASFNVKSKRPK